VCEKRQKFFKAQNDFNEVNEKDVNQDDFLILKDQMNFQGIFVDLVVK